jgi:Ser/Thr protein kinase RdoA (MazF antagonist)
MVSVTELLARVNTLDLQVPEAYDSWGNNNLVAEYAKVTEKLTDSQNNNILEIVQNMQRLDTRSFSKSFIHGDMQRKHIIKTPQGQFAVLDLGCMRYDAKVYDLSTYLAWFCFDQQNWAKHDEIYKRVLSQYTTQHVLSDDELAAIPLLVRASYASYYLKTLCS